MKRNSSISAAWAVVVPVVLLALPAAAQENRGAAGSSAAGTGVAQSGGGGGSRAGGGAGSAAGGGSVSHGGGGSSSGGGSGFSGAGGSGGRVDVGERHATTGGSGVAISRGAERGANGGGGRDRGRDGGSGNTGTAIAVAPAGVGGTTATGAGGDAGSGRAIGRRDGGPRDARTPDGGPAGVPPHARPRNGNEPIVGTAVPRGSVPTTGTGGGTTIVTGGTPFYPWWFGGAGYYGGYYGGYYDPWFGGYPGYYDPDPQVYSRSYADEGSLRLKIKPREAEVYVDGYFVGIVDDFDGIFQRLHIETGPHRIEVRAPGYETLTFDVRITPDHSTTYRGELKRIP